ncbi:hypothetical protein CDCA_CDCA07G2248 [Cyanidium caldarium]|uniref:Translation initiation factor eIF2B subunit gamma n=1 Tax=Cyanidium caldarium TaxID=2771 RepID=A0AAV9IWN9_CYACA|nr:hypothetical protein CDCA_CDCA07G2248 [Cyanidium caldarium]
MSFAVAHASFAQDLQAVVLAGGPGSRMHPFSSGTPKCMLPVVNRPLLFYSLFQLERAGFDAVLLVTCPSALDRVSTYVHELYPADAAVRAHRTAHAGSRGLAVALRALPDGLDTAEVLCHLRDDIVSTDVVVLSGDIVGEWMLPAAADAHRALDASLTMVVGAATTATATNGHRGTQGKKDKKAAAAAANHSNESWNDLQTFIGVDRDTGRLLYTQSAADVADAGGQLRVPREVLQHVRALSVRRDLRDLHVYFLKRWVLDWLQHHPQLGSIRSELVPYLVRHQFALGRRAAAAWEEAQQVPGDDEQRGADVEPVADGAGEPESPATYRRRRRRRPEAPLLPPVPPYAAYSRALFPGGPMAPDDRIRCYAYSALPPHAPSLLRVNTMETYVQANRQVASGVLMPSLQRHLHPYNMNEYDQGTGAATDRAAAAAETDSAAPSSSTDGPEQALHMGERTFVARDSVLAPGSITLGRECQVRGGTIIGRHTVIGDRCKLTACIVMDHVKIGDRCVLQHCVIGSHAEVLEQCDLRHCQIGPHAQVVAHTTASEEVFSQFEASLAAMARVSLEE